MEQQETYLTIKEVMDKLKVSRTTLHRWRRKRLIKAVKIGKLVRLKLSDIEKMMN